MDELSYNGKNFSEFNTFFDGSKAFGSPEKDYELVEIMGRNGSLSIYNDRFKDILLPFPCFVRSAFLTHYRQLVEFLNSQHGYLRLETSKEPNHFRKALFQGIVEPQTTPFNHGGQFTINFLAKPQRFLKSGETPVSSQSQDEDYEGNPSVINNPSGLSTVKSLEVGLSPIQNLNGYEYPWVGGAGKNLFNKDGTFGHNGTSHVATSTGITITTTSTGNNKNASTEISSAVLGQTVTISANVTRSSTNNGNIRLYFCDANNTIVGSSISSTSISSDGAVTITATIPATFPEGATKIMIYLYGCTTGTTGTGLSVTYDDLMLEIGSTASSWSPYSNICPISGHTEVNVSRYSDDAENIYTTDGITEATNNSATITVINDTAFRVVRNTGVYPSTKQTLSSLGLTSGKTYRLKAHAEITTGQAFIATRTSSNTIVEASTHNTTSGDIELVFKYANNANYLSFFCGYNQTTGDVTYSNIFLEEVPVYTTSLGTTVYGGTLDIVSGVLTVDRASVTLDGTQSIIASTSNRFYVTISEAKTVNTANQLTYAGVTSDRLKSTTWGGLANKNGYCSPLYGHGIAFALDSNTTVSDWTTFFTNNPTQFTYELDTPITYQLTPTQVSLLTGVNVISTDGNGDMTVTVTEPTLLVNPTLFESKPLLRIYGTGTVNINDKYITISAHSFPYIDIDCELMDAYYGSSNANQYVTFSDNDYITLKSGNNYIAYGNQIEVTPRWYEI